MMRKMVLLMMFGGIIFLFFYDVVKLQAQIAPHLVISEIQVGGATAEDEFVELYNPTAAAIDISSWSIQYKSATGTIFQKKNFDSGDSVPAYGFFLIARNAYDGAVLADMTQGTFSLAASGGNIFLVSNQTLLTSANNATIADKVAYGAGDSPESASAPAPLANQSIERYPGGTNGNGADTNNNANDFFTQTNPNPRNSGAGGPISDSAEIGSSDIHIGDVVINELVPNPSDGAEWVEFYNNTASAINLEGSNIFDGTGNSVKLLSGSILAQGFFVAELSSARLNNSGDLVVFKNADNEIIDQVSYGNWDDGNTADNAPNSNSGQAVARKSNGVDTNYDNVDFAVSDQTTQGASNIIQITTTRTQGGTNVNSNLGTVPLPKIVINEFAVDLEKHLGWVELYIGGEVSMDLEGWYLEEGSESKTNLSGTLIPGQFKVIEKINGALNNAGDIIRLKNKDGEVYDSVSYGVWEDGKLSDNAPVAQFPFSVARIQDGVDDNNDKNDFKSTSAATKGYGNKIEKIETKNENKNEIEILGGLTSQPSEIEFSPVVKKLFINEILPNPEGSDSEEWLELFWAGDAPLDLDGFTVDDKEGGSSPFILSNLTVKPNEYVLLKRELTKLAFNNDTDEARLFAKNGEMIDEIEYEEGEEGLSYARGENGIWGWTSKPTPSQQNALEIKNKKLNIKNEVNQTITLVELSGVRDLELGVNARVKGIVAVLPGVLGSQIFYIVDGLSGLQVYSNKKNFPKLELGDLIEITGTLSQAQGETRIKIKTADNIRIISKGNALLAHEFMEEEINEAQEGSLVKIKGTIIDKVSFGFIIDTSFGEFPVAIKKTTGINIREIIPGLRVIITGIIGNSTAGYRLLPRDQTDIEVVGVDELFAEKSNATNAPKESAPYAKATAYAGGGAILAALGIRRRKLFTNGFRAALFVINKRKNNGKGLI